jgi:thiol-disulfide isomerase/thioredoxin
MTLSAQLQRRGLLAVALIAFALVGARQWVRLQRRAAEESVLNFERPAPRQAPAMLLVGADGSQRPLADTLGKPVLVHFWATWCPPCRRELPSLLDLGRRLEAEGRARFVAISVDDDWGPVRTFFGGQVPSEVVMDGRDAAAETWQLALLPETYLLAPDGTTRLRFVGPRDWTDERAADVLLEAAAGQESPGAGQTAR